MAELNFTRILEYLLNPSIKSDTLECLKPWIHLALQEQGYEYKDGQIVLMEYPDEDTPEHAHDYCVGCTNSKGCITCHDGDQWATYEDDDDDIADKPTRIKKGNVYKCVCSCMQGRFIEGHSYLSPEDDKLIGEFGEAVGVGLIPQYFHQLSEKYYATAPNTDDNDEESTLYRCIGVPRYTCFEYDHVYDARDAAIAKLVEAFPHCFEKQQKSVKI